MSGFTFPRRVGAAADVLELQYVVALHQTTPRDNATLSSWDVRSLLASKYGLRIQPKQAEAVVRALGGTTTRLAAAAADSTSDKSKTKRRWIRSPRNKAKKKGKPRGEERGWTRSQRSAAAAAAAGRSEHQGANKGAPSLKDAARDSVE